MIFEQYEKTKNSRSWRTIFSTRTPDHGIKMWRHFRSCLPAIAALSECSPLRIGLDQCNFWAVQKHTKEGHSGNHIGIACDDEIICRLQNVFMDVKSIPPGTHTTQFWTAGDRQKIQRDTITGSRGPPLLYFRSVTRIHHATWAKKNAEQVR